MSNVGGQSWAVIHREAGLIVEGARGTAVKGDELAIAR